MALTAREGKRLKSEMLFTQPGCCSVAPLWPQAVLYWKGTMSDDKIYVDPGRPATLNNGGALDDCPTLQEAVMAWHRLSPEQKKRATIRVMGGPLYTAAEIERLHFGREPPS